LRVVRAAILAVSLLGVAGEAEAVIGRPLTPMSYAGVARRTTRRAAYRGAYYGGGGYYGAGYGAGYYGAAAAASTAYVTSLPPSCTTVVSAGVSYRSCDGNLYRPYYQGTTVVYQPQ